MVRTKYVRLRVICQACDTDLHFFGVRNIDNLKCDACGLIRNRVTFTEEANKLKGEEDEK